MANLRVIKSFHKRFANGEQYLTIGANGKITNTLCDYFWQERAVYNRILPIIRSLELKYKDLVTEDLLYGECGLVALLVPIQRAYNSICNRKTEYVNRIVNSVLIVEDGSVDIEALEEEGVCPGKVVVYRSGANKPTFDCPNMELLDYIDKEIDRLLKEFVGITDGFIAKLEVINIEREQTKVLEEELKRQLRW